MKYLCTLLLLCGSVVLLGQERIVFNGGYITLQGGAYLVVDNGAANALTRMDVSGGLWFTDRVNYLRWRIGNAAATFTVPLVHGTTPIPVTFTTTGAAGAGYFDLSTYQTPTWKNSDYLPPGVANVNRNGTDNSAYTIDRFWSLNAAAYTAKPALTNLLFTYRDEEWNAPGNTISESLLKAQRWNSTANTWGDYPPTGVANATTNTVTLSSVAAADLFEWWTLVSSDFPLPVTLVSFTATAQNNKTVLTEWNTSLEYNTAYFDVERSQNALSFTRAESVLAAGNSSVGKNYSYVDASPYSGRSYYRLKMVDRDGTFRYSQIVPVSLNGDNRLRLYPNPAVEKVVVESGSSGVKTIVVTDASGKLILEKKSPLFMTELDVSALPAGVYWIKLVGPTETQTVKLIKAAK